MGHWDVKTRVSSTTARWLFAARATRFEGKVLMLIRIAYRDKCLAGQKVNEGHNLIVPLTGYLKASYADRKEEFRILCGSI